MKQRYILTVIALSVLVAGVTARAGLPHTKITFENGLTAIFVENHSSPMITSIVFVNAGARYETEFNNGATHFLEHLLFNGTKTKSQEQLDDLIKRHGGYINAFTRKDLTAYLVLMPTEFIDHGLDVQSDQLFNSIIPAGKLDKERKIVIEEIRQSNDRITDLVDDFHSSVLFAGTPYARPVLGFEHLINTITRDEIVDYYQTYYAPNNMTALVIGDFRTEAMVRKYRNFFGTVPPKRVPPEPQFALNLPDVRKVISRELDCRNVYLTVSSRAPLYSDPDYYAFYLLNELLNTEGVSPLLKALKSPEVGGIQSVSTGITTQKDFTLFDVSVIADSAASPEQILGLVNQTVENVLSNWQPTGEDLRAIVISKKTEEVYLREKLHYYGFMIAPLMVATGYDFIDNMSANLEQVTPADVKRAAARHFRPYNYIATAVTPPQRDPDANEQREISSYLHRTMSNGLEVIIKSNPYSQVQAFMVLGKDRCASEPDGKEGITDFVNRMVARATKNYAKDELSRALNSIGANLTVSDNPYIPYDDRYTVPQFSFIKFETISDFTDRGIELLAELVRNAAFPEPEVEAVRGEMIGIIGMQSAATREQARNLFYRTLFGGSAYAKPIAGTAASISNITVEDLRGYHRDYYAPNNLILSVCTDLEPETVFAKLESAFGDMQPRQFPKKLAAEPQPVVGEISRNLPLEKKQSYIYLGHSVCSATHDDALPLRIAVSILSNRLQQDLRERQGLAYRLGAGIEFDREFGWFYVAMGTGTENYSQAKWGILRHIDSLRAFDVSADELERSVNSTWGSELTARLSRINQAFYMAANQFIAGRYDLEDDLLARMMKLTPADIKRAATQYLDPHNYVLATVGAPEAQ